MSLTLRQPQSPALNKRIRVAEACCLLMRDAIISTQAHTRTHTQLSHTNATHTQTFVRDFCSCCLPSPALSLSSSHCVATLQHSSSMKSRITTLGPLHSAYPPPPPSAQLNPSPIGATARRFILILI